MNNVNSLDNLSYSERKRAKLAYQWFFSGCKNINELGLTTNLDHTGPQIAIGREYEVQLQKNVEN